MNNEKINWKQKLTSRKFWAAIIAVVVAVCTAFGVPDMTTEQITAIISACGVLIAYILGESLVDAKRAEAENTIYIDEGIELEEVEIEEEN